MVSAGLDTVPGNLVMGLAYLASEDGQRIQKKAYERGYDPRISTVLRLEYVEDGARSGRPKTASSEVIEQAIIQNGL